MAGISIFMHAVRMVLGNLGPALRIGVVPLLVLAVAGWALGSTAAPVMGEGMARMPSAGAFGGGLLLIVVQILVSLWIAVAWHRYILLEEQPGAFLPNWNGAAIWSYFKVALIIGVILTLVAIPLSLVAGFLIMPVMMTTGGTGPGLFLGLILLLIVGIPMTWLGYRLGPSLAGAAIGDPRTLAESWGATARGAIDLLALALVSVLAFWAAQLVVLAVVFTLPFLAVLLTAVVNWITVMIGVGIVTTIFGHYVQGRALNA